MTDQNLAAAFNENNAPFAKMLGVTMTLVTKARLEAELIVTPEHCTIPATLHGGAPKTWFQKINDGYTAQATNPDGTPIAMPPFRDVMAREQIWLTITYLQSLDIDAPATGGAR